MSPGRAPLFGRGVPDPGVTAEFDQVQGAGKKTSAKQEGGQRKPRELRQLVIEIANWTGFGYTRINKPIEPRTM